MDSLFRRVAFWVLGSIAGITGSIIILRAFIGPLPMHINSPMNAESAFGFAIISMLLARSAANEDTTEIPQHKVWQNFVFAAALVLITAAAFRRTVNFYFLSDDFILLKYANVRPDLRALFSTGGGDGFFRPVGYLSLALNSLWASLDPAFWHASSVTLHVINVLLVFALSLQIGSSRIAAFFAAILFSVHGSRPEAVAWIASHFDRISTFFVLCGLVLFAQSLKKARHPAVWRILSLACMVLAILSKESAYTFPVLLLLFMVLSRERGRPGRNSGLEARAPGNFRILIPFFAVAALLFAWRWILVGGIGGYRDLQTGRPMAAVVRFIPAVKVLFFRLWAVLFFPVNWKIQPGLVVSIFLACCILALFRISAARISRKRLVFSLGFVLITALPPLHLLLIGSDLQGARLLYLPSVGFCLLLAIAAEKTSPRMRFVLPVLLIAFQWAALGHNLERWEYASKKAKAACAAAVQCKGPVAANAEVLGLPGSLDGVYFFANGFPECIEMQHEAAKKAGRLVWDPFNRELRCVSP